MAHDELELFRGVAAFVAVAEELGFRRAGVRLGVSAAAVSKAVQKLEATVGAQLFVRGPRAVSLTREGETLLAHWKPALAAVRSGRAAVDTSRKQPHGELVLSASFVVAPLVTAAVALLGTRHPRLHFTLRVTDRLARLGEEGVDVAVRVGALEDSGLIARKLRSTRLLTVASPAYLTRAGTPRRASELEGHACIVAVGPRGKPFDWVLRDGLRPTRALVQVDYGPAVLDAVLAGVGIGQLFDFMAEPYLEDRRLLSVLPEQVAPGPDVFAVCAPGRQGSARVRAAFEALEDAFRAPA